MPLPREGSRWLPPLHAPAYDRYRLDEALWLNDTDTLRAILGGATNANEGRTVQELGRRRGVLVDLVRRWAWARQPAVGEKRTDLPTPIGAALVDLSAAQLMSEPPMFRLTDDDKEKRKALKADPRQARVDTILNSDDARQTLIGGAQVAAAIGGAVLKAQWDTADPDRESVWFDAVGADCAIPEFNAAGRLTGVVLWQEYPGKGSKVLRHLEYHRPGGIEHALYEGTPVSVGRMVRLDRVDELAGILALEGIELSDAVAIIPTGMTRLTAAFWRNRTTRKWRRSGGLSNLGRSDFELIEPQLDAYSETWGSLMRDVRLGKARAFLPVGVLERIGQGQGGLFDSDREFYQEVGGLNPDAGAEAIKVEQPEIRWESHMRTLAGLKLEMLDEVGWSLSSYGNPIGIDGQGGNVTATEVNDRTTKSERTRDEKALQFKQSGNPFARMLLELDAILYPGAGGGEVPELSIDFPDVSQVDPAAQARTFLDLSTARAISIEQTVRERRPNWDDDQVDDEVARIMADIAALEGGAALDPATLGREQIALTDPAGSTPPPADQLVPSSQEQP